MGITASSDINHSIDISTSQIEQKQTGKSEFEKSLDNINSKLALQGLKLELPTKSLDITRTDEERKVLELVKKIGLKTSFENNRFSQGVNLNKIQDGVFSVVSNKTGNVNYFVDEKGKIIFGLSNTRERAFISNGKAFEEAGYIDKNENGKFNLYKLTEKGTEGPIDINSPEYYKAWNDIIFYDSLYTKFLELKHSRKNGKEGIKIYVDEGGFKFEDLELFKSKGMIDDETFAYGISEIRKVLVSQCNDTRLITLTGFKGESLGIKESDLKTYLKKGYIDDKLALECFKVLPKEMKDLSK